MLQSSVNQDGQEKINQNISAAQLYEAEAKYRTLVEQIPAVTYVASLETPGKLLYISPQVEQLGFSVDEWLSYPDGLLKQVHHDDLANVIVAFAQVCENHTPMRCEMRLIKYGGEVRWYMNEAKVVCNEVGNACFLQGILIDITLNKENEEELLYYHRHLEELVVQRTAQLEKQNAILDSANINLAEALEAIKHNEVELRIAAAAFETQNGIIVANVDKIILRVNNAFTRIAGYKLEQVIGKTPFFLRSGMHDQAFYDVLWATVERDGYWEGELWNKRENGEVFPVWQTITKVKDSRGQTSHYVGCFTDISAQKQAEKVLSEARIRLSKQVANTQEELEQIKTETLQINTALNVLLKHRHLDKSEAQIALSHQVEETLLPLLKKLKGQSIGRVQSARIIGVLETNLQQLVETFGNAARLDALYRKLTPIETQVAAMVRQGLPTKTIAATLNSSAGTVESHRKHIRKKLGLAPQANLHSYLLSLTEQD